MTERQDAWTEQDDIVLTGIVLDHIRKGSTQLKAFEEAGERLERTPAACGFRWNAAVRKQVEDEIARAKQERTRKGSRSLSSDRLSIHRLVESEPMRNHPLYAAIKVINRYVAAEEKQEHGESRGRIAELENLLAKQEMEIEALKLRLEKAEEAELAVTEDYKNLLKILRRARDMGVLHVAEEEAEKPAFKMDANGNLERIG